MKTRFWIAMLLCVLVSTAGRAAEEKPAPTNANPKLDRQISQLVGQLNGDKAAERDAAEKQLLELAGSTTAQSDRFLELLPKENDQMPLSVRDRLSRIRQQVEDRSAKAATGSSTITLKADKMPLAEVFAAIEKQTGNKLIDNREDQDGKEGKSGNVTIDLKAEPFWSAIDQILDQAKLGVYSYGGEEALSIVARNEGDGSRHGQAVYQGPFRLEVLDVQAQRGRRQPGQNTLKLQLEVAWSRDCGGGNLATSRRPKSDDGHWKPTHR